MMIEQPLLLVPNEIELGLLEGSLKLFGSVVREADTGRIYKHLTELAPSPEKVEEAVRSMKLNPKVVISVVAVVAAVGGSVTYLVKKRKDSKLVPVEDLPECITNFDAALRAYIEAGREGALDAEIVEQLLRDLDAIEAFSQEGNEVKISLDDLLPMFNMVIAHTSRLAEAYDVELEDIDEQGDSEDGVVVSLRRHLEAQKAILPEAS
ncbi:hypothetical protein [Aeromicrobium wangtongii]|uniref:Uncharacterized protein n=1 Tax=Aeromicrobium wangtongii TaxID=2969247 RepID=A0ABY5MHB2_9ACTN|nr:hypothetical protein [Aeromicrobium wangtongii]MCD9197799.1 hypothetical protein [Aeromicrobium wangtongii]UUP15281.1 hypothetical protein NQV15_08210 [Aeromicrobium wangtongii]